jgi:hypothetical protein
MKCKCKKKQRWWQYDFQSPQDPSGLYYINIPAQVEFSYLEGIRSIDW